MRQTDRCFVLCLCMA